MENHKDSPLLHIKREFHPLNFNYAPSPVVGSVEALVPAPAAGLRS